MEKQDSMHEKYVNQKIEEGAVYTREEERVYLNNKWANRMIKDCKFI